MTALSSWTKRNECANKAFKRDRKASELTNQYTRRDDEMSHGAGAAGTTTEFRDYQWAYNVMDSSRVSTCLISMLLIVYGSFRSLNMEQEQREREKKRQNDSMNNLLTGEPVQQEQSKYIICMINVSFWLPFFYSTQ